MTGKKGPPEAVKAASAQDALNVLARTSAAIVSQIVQGHHLPTNMQLAMLLDALEQAAPHLTQEMPGMVPISAHYVQAVRREFDARIQRQADNARAMRPKGRS